MNRDRLLNEINTGANKQYGMLWYYTRKYVYTLEQLTAAKQTAEQGSQQLQGEILELDVERDLQC